VYLLHSKKKWNASSRATPQAQFGLDTIFASVREWNKLENSVHNLDTPLKFKRTLLSKRNEINIVPKHFMYGSRKLNVILTQLRCSTSFLNNDWFKSNIVSSPNCAFGVARHTWNVWEQYLFHFFCLVTYVWILMGCQDYGQSSQVYSIL
jgi:hypothetical protein